MKNFILVLIVSFILAAQQQYESVGFANPDDMSLIEKFELSEYTIKKLSFGFSGYASNKSDSSNSLNGYYYSLNPKYQYSQLSDNILLNFYFQNSFSQSGADESTLRGLSNNNNLSKMHAISAQTDYKMYDQINYSSSAYINHNYTESSYYKKFSPSDLFYESDENESFSRSLDIYLKISIGFGKIRNIKPLIKSLRINERFKSIKGKTLSDSEILKLSEIINQESSYTNKYDRSEKYFYSAIFESTESLNNLTYAEKKYLEDSFLENYLERFDGFEVDFGAYLFHSKNSGSSHRYLILKQPTSPSIIFQNSESEFNYYGPQLQLNYYKNLALNCQINVKYNISYGLAKDVGSDGENSTFGQSLRTNFIYNISDRFLINSNLILDNSNYYSKFNNISTTSVSTNTLFDLEFDYFIENEMKIFLKSIFNEGDISFPFDRGNQFTFGMSYYLFRE